MNFEAILEAIKNPAIVGGVLTATGGVIAIIVKVSGAIKAIKKDVGITQKEIVTSFREAMPKEITISVEKLVSGKMDLFTAEIKEVLLNQIVGTLAEQIEIVGALAEAVSSIKSIPQNLREDIASLTGKEKPKNTAETVKLEINTALLKEEKKPSKKIQLV